MRPGTLMLIPSTVDFGRPATRLDSRGNLANGRQRVARRRHALLRAENAVDIG